MARQLFVNLPVKDLDKTVEFFTALGFSFNPDFTDENATCMIVNDDALRDAAGRGAISRPSRPRPSPSHGGTAEAIMSFSLDSREAVDEAIRKALTAGGTPSQEAQDYGFMYTHSFQDPDGHLWEVFWMDPAGPPKDAAL